MTTLPGLWIIDKIRDARNDTAVIQLFGPQMAEKIFLEYQGQSPTLMHS